MFYVVLGGSGRGKIGHLVVLGGLVLVAHFWVGHMYGSCLNLTLSHLKRILIQVSTQLDLISLI